MPRDLSGTFTPARDWEDDATNDVPFDPVKWNEQDEDFADGLNYLPVTVPAGTDVADAPDGSFMYEDLVLYYKPIGGTAWVTCDALSSDTVADLLALLPNLEASDYTAVRLDPLTGFDGVETDFSLLYLTEAFTPVSAASLLVNRNGSWQEETTTYTVTGSTISFDEAPGATEDIFILALNFAALDAIATQAEAAQTAAETAQGLAETAQTAAEAAQTAAETAETNAETAETNAETAQTAAEAARDAAVAASETLAWGFTFDDALTSGAGSAELRMNNASLASVTELYVSETSDEGDISSAMATWDDSNSSVKGSLKIRNPLAPTSWVEFQITGNLTDNGTDRTVPVTYVAHSGAFSDADALLLMFIRNGDTGTGAVDSFNGRTAAVVPATGDYDASQVDNDSGVSGAKVSDALDTLNSAKQAVHALLTAIAGLTPTDGNIVIGNGSTFIAEGGSTARLSLGVESYTIDDIAASFNGVLTTFDLEQSAVAVTPNSPQCVTCIYNGVVQVPGSAFTISGSQISFSGFTPQFGDTCDIWVLNV